MSDAVRITPLGGLGEIGLNMMVMEALGQSMVIDCGLMFPEPHMPGIDIVIPDFGYIKKSGSELKGVILTHGHEDHIGALPFFLRSFRAPVFGTSLTLGLLENKLKQHDLDKDVELVTVRRGDSVTVGPFSVEFIPVCHSIPDGSALAIDTPQGFVVHSGDFKFDDTPVDGIKTGSSRFAYYGKRGVRLLLSDSTNVECPGKSGSDQRLAGIFEESFSNCDRKVFVSLFSSNINRIQQIIAAAEKSGRKIVLVGRSLVANIKVALERGYLKANSDTIIGVKEMAAFDPSRLAVITTGSQGEPMSGLSLMTAKSHKYVSIDEGDRVILSSKSIPGNEKLICRIINQLVRNGAEVLYEKIADVHVSGHGHRDELESMINLTSPDYFIPIHGEQRHLARHARLAQEAGVLRENTLIAEDGDRICIDKSGVRLESKVKTGRIFVDGKGVGDVKDLVLRDRMHLSNDGMVLAVISLNSSSGEVINSIELFTKGLIREDQEEILLNEARHAISGYLADACSELKRDWSEMEAETAKVLKRFFKKRLGRRPVIIPVIIEL